MTTNILSFTMPTIKKAFSWHYKAYFLQKMLDLRFLKVVNEIAYFFMIFDKVHILFRIRIRIHTLKLGSGFLKDFTWKVKIKNVPVLVLNKRVGAGAASYRSFYTVGWVDIRTSKWVPLECVHFYEKVPKTAKKKVFGSSDLLRKGHSLRGQALYKSPKKLF
jgi:hypothetical protein